MIDEHTLQKLVDGELGTDQIQNLLRSADQAGADGDQTHWKQMAVAFAENQLIQRSFGDFNSASTSSADSAADSANANISNAPTEPAAANKGNSALLNFVLAASLLIGTALLLQNIVSTKPILTTPSVATTTTPDADVATDDEKPLLPFNRRTLAALTPDHQLNPDVLPAAFGQSVRRQVPLYDAKRFDRRQLNQLRSNNRAVKSAWFNQVIPSGGISDQMVADYEKAGMLVDQEIEFLSGRLEDGRPYMIPYRTVRFTAGQ